MTAKRINREAPIQRAIVKWLEAQHPQWIVHFCKAEINKSGDGVKIEMANAKRNGLKPGFPDLIVLPWAHIGPLFLEVKAEGNYTTTVQKEMHSRMRALGYRVTVVRSIEDVQEALREWGVFAGHDYTKTVNLEHKGEIS